MSHAVTRVVQAVGSVFTGDAFGKSGGGSAPVKAAGATTAPAVDDTAAATQRPVYSAGDVAYGNAAENDLLGNPQGTSPKRRAASRTLLG